MSIANRMQDVADGLCLACLGGLLAALALSPHYWYFLNPKFSTLTLGCGGALVLAGLPLLLAPRPGKATAARLTRQAILLAFLSLAAYAWDQAASAPAAGILNPGVAQAVELPDAAPQAPPVVTKNGTDYQRLNLAELYIMVDKGRTDYPAHFAMRVQVARENSLEGAGLARVERTAVVCCLADSLQLSFLAQGLGAVKSGEWVEVFGRLEPLDEAGQTALKDLTQGQGVSIKVVNPKFRVVAESVEPIAQPGFPYVFEFREQPPFAW